MKPFVAGLISRGKCTLNELRTVYTLEDALTIWEAVYVPLYNDLIEEERRAEELARANRMRR